VRHAKKLSLGPQRRLQHLPLKLPGPQQNQPPLQQSQPPARSRNILPHNALILASVEKATKSGKTTLKAALQQLEVSEQTYYNWKNAAGKTAPAAAKAKTTAGASDDLKALIALEAENLKLRKELAAKLRAENEELRRRLGQA